ISEIVFFDVRYRADRNRHRFLRQFLHHWLRTKDRQQIRTNTFLGGVGNTVEESQIKNICQRRQN
ncbi:hypothetical protein NC651_022411, partial [Populus alba x Populus x berolinensis]